MSRVVAARFQVSGKGADKFNFTHEIKFNCFNNFACFRDKGVNITVNQKGRKVEMKSIINSKNTLVLEHVVGHKM